MTGTGKLPPCLATSCVTRGPGPSEDIPAPSTIIQTSGSSLTCSKTCVTFSPSLITSSGIMPSSFSMISAKILKCYLILSFASNRICSATPIQC